MPVRYFLAILLLLSNSLFAQTAKIDTSIFSDAAHHWYDISENDRVINPLPGRPTYLATNIAGIADNILLYQKENGGWPKNYDMQAILSDAQKDSLAAAKKAINTTFDNRTTYSQIRYLAKAYAIIKNERYKQSVLSGLDFIIASQYENGGWPQYYPIQPKNYSRYITYNDDAMSGILWLLKDIYEGKSEYDFIDPQHREKLGKAWEKGLDCVLKTQINDAGKPTAWCQQYDEVTLQPAWARAFEPPSICNGESVNIVLLLMSVRNPTQEVLDAVSNAVAWFNESKILGTKVQTIDAPLLQTKYTLSRHDRVVVQDSTAAPIWTRYYELKTHRPLFCNRDSKVVYSLAEVDRERRDGYTWYTYEPQKVLNKYADWKKKLPVASAEDLHQWQAPYDLKTPKGWGVEHFPLPPSFAPAITYIGMEDIRFMPGWAKKASDEYWSYAFLWYLDKQPKLTEKKLKKSLEAYYSGLFKVNTGNKTIPDGLSTEVKVAVSRIDNGKKEFVVFNATVSMPDYMTLKPIVLNLIIRDWRCPGGSKAFIFTEASPKAYGEEVWKKLDELWTDFRCSK